MTALILTSILLAIFFVSGMIWAVIKRIHYINEDRAEVERRLRNISR